MGEVYLAEDTSLERKVALKFLPEGIDADPMAQKTFLREASLRQLSNDRFSNSI